jgi:hypothetical protein
MLKRTYWNLPAWRATWPAVRGLLLAACLAVLAGRPLAAGTLSYSLAISESLAVLNDPMNKVLMMNEAWKTQHVLMLERTMPYVELRNTSEEGAITQLSLSIGDASKNFDWGSLVEASPGVTFSLELIDAVIGGLKSDTLVVKFTGLDPGRFVRFRVGLSPDDPAASMIVDYRTALLSMNGVGTGGTASVDFATADGPVTLTDPLPDFDNPMPTSTTMAFEHTYGMDMVMPFSFAGLGSTPSEPEEPVDPSEGPDDPDDPDDPQVPEPASLTLFALGLATLAGWKVRKRRRHLAR